MRDEKGRFVNGHSFTPSMKFKMRLSKLGTKQSEKTKEKRSKALTGRKRPQRPREWCINLGASLKGRKAWNKGISPSEEVLKRWFASCKIAPNKKELLLNDIIQKVRPADFIYSGNGKIFIAGKVPDWFNVNGKKQIIELFGNYWHGQGYTGKTKEQEEKQRVDHFKKYGYDCLIVWESELKNTNQLIEKIRSF